MKSTIIRFGSYFIVFILALAFFAIRGIDENMIKTRVATAIAGETGLDVEIGSAGISPFLSLHLEEIVLNAKDGTEIKLDAVKARILWTPLMFARVGVRIVAYAGDGSFLLDLKKGGGKFNIAIKSRRFPIHKTILKIAGQPIPFNAEIEADGSMEVDPASLKNSTGELELSIKEFKVTSSILGKKLTSQIKTESASCIATVKDRMLVTKLCKVVTPAGDFELKLSSPLSDKLEASPFSGTLLITPKMELLKQIVGLYVYYFKKDGSYHFPLKGTLAKPEIAL